MAKTDLKKVQREAKKIRERHPNMSNAHVMKKAWSEARGGKVSGVKKKRTGKRKAVGKKRKAVGAKPRYYAREVHEVRRVGAIKYTGGKVSISGHVSDVTKRDYEKARHRYLSLVEQLGWYMAVISQEKNIKEKKRLQQRARGLKNAVAAEKRLMDSLESRIK
jgi:hypothetical protein